jgi:hypothetical protein
VRRLVGGDSAPSLPGAANTVVRGARIFAVRGCGTSGTADSWVTASSRSNNAVSATVTFATITPGADNSLLLAVEAYEDDPPNRSTPAGWAAPVISQSALGNDMALAYSTRTWVTGATATGAITWTVSGTGFANSVNVGILLAFAPALAAPGAAYGATVWATAGLQSYWRLAETGTVAADSKGPVTGTVVGSPTRDQTSLMPTDSTDRHTIFDGVNDAVTIASAAYNFSGTAAFSVELLVKLSTVAGGTFAYLVDKQHYSATRNGWSISQNGADIGLEVYSAGAWTSGVYVTGLSAGVVYHLVFTADASNLRSYKDGTLASTTARTSIPAVTNNLRLGTATTNFSYLTGVLDEVAIYDVTLAGATITTHAASALAAGGGAAVALMGQASGAGGARGTLGLTRRLVGTSMGRAVSGAVARPLRGLAGASRGASTIAAGTGWTPTFVDDFDGSSLNTAVWQTTLPWGSRANGVATDAPGTFPQYGNAEQQYYLDANVVVAGGAVTLVGKREDVTAPYPPNGSLGSPTWHYTSGILSTPYTLNPSPPCLIEIRAQLPAGANRDGYWCAFWLLAQSLPGLGDWPWPPEVDILEHLGHQPTIAHEVLHSGQGTYGDGTDLPTGNDQDTGVDLAAGFHVYALERATTFLGFRIDGVEVFRLTEAANGFVNGDRGRVPDAPMYLILNFAIGGTWPTGDGHPVSGATTFPASYTIDYVRVSVPAPVGLGLGRALAGRAAGAATGRGDLTVTGVAGGPVALAGTAGSRATATARLTATRPLVGRSSGLGLTTARLQAARRLAGTAIGQARALAIPFDLAGQVTFTDARAWGRAAATAALRAAVGLIGGATGTSSSSSDLTVTAPIGGPVALAGQAAGRSMARAVLSLRPMVPPRRWTTIVPAPGRRAAITAVAVRTVTITSETGRTVTLEPVAGKTATIAAVPGRRTTVTEVTDGD